MARCRACGGVLGLDCYNEQDCLQISANNQYYDDLELRIRDVHIESLEQQVSYLMDVIKENDIIIPEFKSTPNPYNNEKRNQLL